MSLNYQVIIKMIGIISVIIGLAMVPAYTVSLIYDETSIAIAFLAAIIPAVIIGFVIIIKVKPLSSALKVRDGYAVVAVCWILASSIGALPYMFSGILPSFIDAFFESVSGFTTTGCTIIDNPSELPKGILFWRSFSHWLGGISILVLAISFLPTLGINGLTIASSETLGPKMEKMSMRMSAYGKSLYLMYCSFTVIEFILLLFGGLNVFDALIHTFGSMGTGGFSNYNNGILHFNNGYVESVIIFFSALASVNFLLYQQLLKGRWKEFLKDTEFRAFLGILAGACLLIALNLKLSGTYDSIGDAFRFSAFQTTSFMSTSGYSTADYTLWPSFSQMILFSLLFIGGCSASTCGSIKVIRIIILFKLVVRGLYKRLHPNAVFPIKLGEKTISADTVSKVTSFTVLYFTIFIVSILLLSLENLDFITTISAAAGALSNTGLGLGLLGPAGKFSIFSELSRLYLAFLMIAGRLELYSIILLITPSFWKSK